MREEHANKIRDDAHLALFERAGALDVLEQHERPIPAQTIKEPHAPCGRRPSIRGRRVRDGRFMPKGTLPADSALGCGTIESVDEVLRQNVRGVMKPLPT